MADLETNEQFQELILILRDRLGKLNKVWLYAFGACLVLSIPLYVSLQALFYQAMFADYEGPAIIYQPTTPEPLVVEERGIFQLGENSFAGFVRIRNPNLERGVPLQTYTAEFRTAGGTLTNRVDGSSYILPSSEKLLVFSRFTSDETPSELRFTLKEARFVYRPVLPSLNLEISRTELGVENGNFVVSAAVKNLSPFTIKQIDLPVMLFDQQNQIVGVNFTNVNEVKSQELRSFRMLWPSSLSGVVRAAIMPEVNIWDRGILTTPEGLSPYDSFGNESNPFGQ